MTAIREITKVKPGGAVEVCNPALPPGEEVEVIVLVDAGKKGPSPQPQPAGRRLKLDWGGALADLASQSTSVQLQPKAHEWRGDHVPIAKREGLTLVSFDADFDHTDLQRQTPSQSSPRCASAARRRELIDSFELGRGTACPRNRPGKTKGRIMVAKSS